jgi:hypothetical protein
VLRALTERGVDTTGFVARGYGEQRPVATNATVDGMAQNRRVAFTVIENDDVYVAPCDSGDGARRNFELSANDTGVTVEGDLNHESYDCANDRWSIVEGGLRYTETDTGLAQGSLHLSYRREGFVDIDAVRGFFVGMYASQSDVDTLATGRIDGIGLNAGIYGAQRLSESLYLDYYLGAATGLHTYDLAFEDPLGAITANGDYLYLAGFAGAAISGELVYGDYTLSPRAGFDFAFSPGGETEVEMALLGVTQSGTLELDAMSGGAVFAELRAERVFDNDNALIALTPRVACYRSLGSLDDDCSIGATLALESTGKDNALSYAIKIGGERGDHFRSATLTARISRRIDLGEISAHTAMTSEGPTRLGASFEMEF